MTDSQRTSGRIITVFGGSGFVGRHLVRALAKRGWRIRVASRRPDLAFHLQPSGRVGQIHAVQANLRYPDSVAAALKGSEAAVNLVGILTPSGPQQFDEVHSAGAATVARTSREAGVKTFVHMSAIGADPASESAYARSKASGEQAVLEQFPDASIVRASVIFGPEDQFFNRFATLARFSPALPLIGGGETSLQPVYVGDVAEAVCRLLDGEGQAGATYELGGPEVKTLREVMEYVCDVIGRKRLLAPLPYPAARLMAWGTEIANSLSLGLLPRELLTTRDQIELLKTSNLVSPAAIGEGRTLEGLGIRPTAIESIVPGYLYRFRKTGQFEARRLS
jgi:uncharacterized protein YbjT (DUF2867 family)